VDPNFRIVRSDTRPHRQREEPQPDIQQLVDGTVGATSTTVWRNWLVKGQAVVPHRHDVEEILLVIDGECSATVDGEQVDLSTGDAVIVPAGVTHAFRHAGTAPASVVAILASPRPLLVQVEEPGPG
jgi:quercetin dioxygenase-like cupin family protein